MDKAKWNRSVRRLTWRVNHRRGGQGGGRILIFLLAAALVVMTAKLLGGLPERLGQELADKAGALSQRLGERLLLENRPLFSYIRGEEQARGAFRFMSEQLFGRELSFEEFPETGADSTDKTGGGAGTAGNGSSGSMGGSTEGSPGGIPGGSAEGSTGGIPGGSAEGSTGGIPGGSAEGSTGGITGGSAEGSPGGITGGSAEDAGDSPDTNPGENTYAPPDGGANKKTDGDNLVQIGENLLEQVKAENKGYGSYLPVGYVHGDIERLPSVSAEGGQTGNGAGGSAGTGSLVGAEPGKTVGESGGGSSGVSGISAAKLLLENNYPLEKLSDSSYLLSNYYIVDSVTSAVPELFDGSRLLAEDLTIGENQEGYQILIYHTHASEGFSDSRPGEVLDTVRGPGEKLAEYLRARGYTVYHDMTAYDRKDGKDNRNYAYTTARPKIEEFLAEHPEVEVIIDLHRDSGAKRVTEIDGKKTAKIMLFNGLCRNSSGPIADLENPNLAGNLSFSLQLNLVGRVLYPDLMYRIYLKNYRYNQHFRKRSLLIELGTEQNTVEEAYNAMEPLAEMLDTVLRKQ